MSQYEFIKTEVEGPLFIVTINRPDQLNCLHPMGNAEMGKAFDEFAANPDLWVAIVTGAGEKAFSAGNDLKFAASGQKSPVPMPASGFGGLTSRYDLYKPVIAAVNGFAMGGGFEIALACDIVIAAERAIFALPEPRVGLAAGAGGLQRLARMIPLKHAMGMMLTGRRVGAEEGQRLGFVTATVPNDQLMIEARRWAAQILECSPMSVRATKQVAMRALGVPDLATAMRNLDYPAYVAMTKSEDTIEGPKAFAEKRKPVWKGR